MGDDEMNDRLSRISTDWDVLRRARGSDLDARAAQELLLLRYGPAVRRYLGRVAGSPEVAEELVQEFSVAVLEGKLDRADPDRGRFRDYVKAVLRNLTAKYHARRKKLPVALEPDAPALAAVAAPEPPDEGFDRDWRDALMARAWSALADAHRQGYVVLRFRAEHEELSSKETAEQLSVRLGRPLTPEAVRQMIHRAKTLLALLLIEEVGQSLTAPTTENVLRELAELELLEYCRPALDS
jgi:RNA polymerase sigma factor (sigma-70 family)